MNDRRAQLLKCIVEGYTHTAQPIGSKYVAEKTGLHVSPATIRNEMAQLEDEGLIAQPHTSAGRIPTIAGIEYYIEHLLEETRLNEKETQSLQSIYEGSGIRGLAKEAASETKSAVIVAHGNTDYYYTGFSHLFSHPEFVNHHLVQAISLAVDQLDSLLPRFMSDRPGAKPKIYIGNDNPLGSSCIAMFVGNEHDALFGFLTPVRTDYAKNLSLLRTIANYL